MQLELALFAVPSAPRRVFPPEFDDDDDAEPEPPLVVDDGGADAGSVDVLDAAIVGGAAPEVVEVVDAAPGSGHVDHVPQALVLPDGVNIGGAFLPVQAPFVPQGIISAWPWGEDPAGKGPKTRARDNYEAILTLESLREEERLPTVAEREVLARWTGWGACSQLFSPAHAERLGITDLANSTRELLGTARWEQARRSTLNAHYTWPRLAKSLWATAETLGFAGGTVLEPGCGAGSFFSAAPAHLAERSLFVGVEQDSITADIAAALHPWALTLHTPYEKFNPNVDEGGVADLVIGNVPFGNYSPWDEVWGAPDIQMPIHDFFLFKSLRLLRPGGILVAVTSRYTLDAALPGDRLALARYGALEGAWRLPSETHAAWAGTRVVTDVLAFRRRPDALAPADLPDLSTVAAAAATGERLLDDPLTGRPMDWLRLQALDRGDYDERESTVGGTKTHRNGLRINAHLAAALPVRVLGRVVADSGHHMRELDVVDDRPYETPLRRDANVPQRLEDAVGVASSAGEFTVAGDAEPVEAPEPATATVVASLQAPARVDGVPGWAVDGSLFLDDDDELRVYLRGALRPVAVTGRSAPAKSKFPELRALLGVRDAYMTLVTAESDGQTDEICDEHRGALRDAYNAYRDAHGPISRFTVNAKGHQRRPFQRSGPVWRDPHYPTLLALEAPNEFGGGDVPADAPILFARQIRAPAGAAGALTVAEAVATACHSPAGLTATHLSELTGMPPDDVEAAATRAGLVFVDPDDGSLVERSAYLTGNVRRRLQVAEHAAQVDASFGANVEALRDVVPPSVSVDHMAFRLSANWLPVDIINDFLRLRLGQDDEGLRVDKAGETLVLRQSAVTRGTQRRWFVPKHGVGDHSPARLLDLALTGKPPAFQYLDAEEVRRPDTHANAVAAELIDELNDSFCEYCRSNPEARDSLEHEFNSRFRSYNYEAPNGDWVDPPGKSEAFELYDHQREAIARILRDRKLLLAHAVGAGKTGTMLCAAMEMRRLGIARRPLLVVPNHLLSSFLEEAARWFPSARILSPPGGDTSAAGRGELVARAMGDTWDLVVIPQSTFGLIGLSPDNEAAFLQEEVERYRTYLADLSDGEAPRYTVKKVEEMLLHREERLRALLAETTHTPGPLFEHLGCDYLICDEAHAYKNLPFTSRYASVAGSSRALDLQMKLRYLAKVAGTDAVCTLATATPLSNRLSECWVMQQLVAPDMLKEVGMTEHDAWMGTFGRWRQSLEVAPTGEIRPRSRLTDFANLPELRRSLDVFADIRTADELGLERPTLIGDAASDVVVAGSEELQDYVGELVTRYKDVTSGNVEPTEDNALKIFSDARKAALDLRFVGRPQPSPNKLEAAADRIATINRRTAEDHPERSGMGSCQLVFCDFGVPESLGGSSSFSAYEELADLLVDRGIPRGKIRFVQEATNDDAKLALWDSCRSGETAVLVGSTEAMGTGVNVQDRCSALHHLNPPYRASDMEQREGRTLRPGNAYDEVDIARYTVEGSFDAALYQLCRYKSRFAQLLTEGDPDDLARFGEIADDRVTLSYEQTVAACMGDDRVIRVAELNSAVAEKQRALSGMIRSQENAEHHRRELAATVRRRQSYLHRLAEVHESHDRDSASVAFDDGSTKTGTAAERHFAQSLSAVAADGKTHLVGTVDGVAITARYVPPATSQEEPGLMLRPEALSNTDPLNAWIPATGHRIADGHYQTLVRVRNMLRNLPESATDVKARLDRDREELALEPGDAYSDIPLRIEELDGLREELAALNDELKDVNLYGKDPPEVGGGIDV